MILYSDDNFLAKDQCNALINIYNQNIDKIFKHREQYPLDIDKLKNLTDRVEKICKDLNPLSELDTHQIVMWPTNSYMIPHLDDSNDLFAALIYLNDDYIGGETCFENTTIKPKEGKLIIFCGAKQKHSVSKITEGTRYTIGMWFQSKTKCNISDPYKYTRDEFR
jgi:hypothetical protein